MANIKPIRLDLSHFDSGYEVNPEDITREKPKNLEHMASGLNRPEGNIMSPKRKSRLPKPPSGQRKKPKRRSSAKAKQLLYKRTGNPSIFLVGKGKRRRKTRKNKKRKSRRKSRKKRVRRLQRKRKK